ncbi:DUF4837 family protein [Rhodocaloribacter litoris]|uniref:DUF4837 family protein n=1 Tax=Rhodocaloribacter litoris TaxID=2558931 RepID=UPI001423E8D2|nr:DUF4837 family protein [Rhodocaloribacter litoris]QXD15768.1 DUF4837 family protein [Rhodocaloribacter litoris]GIV60269.1 MAG: DUF4837 domain-containing protein [Rhodothermaceae bacterium]
MPSKPGFIRALPPLLLALVLLAGCDRLITRPEATGPEGVITVVIDSTHWKGAVGEALREELGRWIGTLPVPERLFRLEATPLLSQQVFETVRKKKNVVFVAPLSDTTGVARFLRSRLAEEAEAAVTAGQRAVIPRRDLWRRHQMVVYLVAATPEDLVQTIRERGDDLRYTFNTITRERMTRSMFEKGRQTDLEARIMERHGFAVNVQHDYFIAIDTTNFIWLRRVVSEDSWRSVFIYYEDRGNPAVLSPEWIYATRDSLTRQYIQGNLGGYVAIDYRRPLETENINFLDRFGYETRGLWHMIGRDESGKTIEFGMGGPFLTYTFYDQTQGRLYMIDGMVFAPNFDKREFLRQIEVIAHTFRTREEAGAAGETAVTARVTD